MSEQGTLGIMRRGDTYQVHYASNNPYEADHQPYACSTETHLEALLHHVGTDAWSIQQTFAELQKGRLVVLPIIHAPARLAAFFQAPAYEETMA
ncbi:MAG: hypothetical protein FJZ47_18800 [Candidatus Tectomicrobia bacterium]|uniref:Uncharacterized protein n=1 Tax=Tectimicrobiota bacterium TaxID=2528274 RepID=A0A937W2N5_UNCTE|nr:hypothetical protein [Candidatus Tectomicrobia bacterium]